MKNRRSSHSRSFVLRALIMALALVMCFACTAYAADVSAWSELKAATNGNATDTYVLTRDITADSTLNITAGDNLTIDLNGHTITRASTVGTLFNINGGRLTIMDSAVPTTTKNTASKLGRDNDASDGTGIARPSSYRNGTLTYYVTESSVNADGISTTETLYAHTVSGTGMIDANNANSPVFRVSGSRSALNITGGMFYNSNNRVIYANESSTVNIIGGYFVDNSVNGNGGVIYADDWNNALRLDISGNAVFAGNRATTGGAVATNGNITMTIGGEAVFSGNAATGNGRDGGGALFIGNSTKATMTGGYITNNWGVANTTGTSDISSYDAGGGGVLVRGFLKMAGGQITANEAAGGGGVSTYFWDGGTFSMVDGIIAGNVARLNEGGGITINLNGSGSIIGGYITNNATETRQHWGGGGVFCADSAVLTMQSVLITDNTAGGYGGGLAGCSTGRIDTHVGVNMLDHSVAVYNNDASGTQLSGDESTKSEDRIYAANDPVFTRDNGAHYQDYFCALNTTVCGGLLGGGTADWSGTVDGEPLAQGTISKDERVSSQYITGLTSHPTSADIGGAIAKAKVFVTGNSSGTHGGGILCNGYLVIGTQREIAIGDRMTLVGDKTLSGSELTAGQFKFHVYDEQQDKIIMTGTNNAKGEIEFPGRIPFEEAGTYTFRIYEDQTSASRGIIYDPTVYYVTVTVTATRQTVQAPDPDSIDVTAMETIVVTYNKISRVVIQTSTDGGATKKTIATFTNINSSGNTAYQIERSLDFTNRTTIDTGIVVSKIVHDETNSSADAEFEFTVTLSDTSINGQKGQMTFKNGVATFTLKAGESMKAIDLPVNVRYTVTETAKNGYYNGNPTHVGTVVGDVVTPVIFDNYAVGSLTVKKTVEGGNSVDNERYFDFRITLTDGYNITGRYGDIYFENGVALVELKHGESITASNLPAGTRYTVAEIPLDGFTAVENRIDGTISVGQTQTASFINTRDKGELHVKKRVNGNPTDQDFSFTVELVGSAHLAGTYGDMTFVAENGSAVANITLKDGETKRATGIPTGTPYRVTEVKHGDYAVSVVGRSNATIGDSPMVVEYINTEYAGLAISKMTTGTVNDRNAYFTFKIDLKNANQTIDGTYGDVTFTNGSATIQLKNNESVTVTGLPAGTEYTVTEIDVDRDLYIVRANDKVEPEETKVVGVLEEGAHEHADFVNMRRVGQLEISKTVTSSLEIDKTRLFGFNIELSEPITGKFGDITFDAGKATIYLADGQKMTAVNIPYKITYTVTEIEDPQFVSTGTNTSGTIGRDNALSSVSFRNTRRMGDLQVKKTIEGVSASDDEFNFKVTLNRDITGVFGEMTFTHGVAEFTLKANETKTATNLPDGVNFTVIETGFDATKFVPEIPSFSGDIKEGEVTEVEMINIAQGSLTVSKTITGDGADMDKKFAFTVTLGNTAISGVYGEMEFVSGVATFELGHDETKTATGLPYGTTYTVTEENGEYDMTSTGETGIIPALGNVEAAFVNNLMRERSGLKVTKLVAENPVDAAQKFTFTVTFGEDITGTFGEMEFVSGVATFELAHNESKTAADLPVGVSYKVEETAEDGYTVSVEGETEGSIVANVTPEVIFTNTRDTGKLKLSKTVTGEGADLTDAFTFVISMKDRNGDPVSATYTGSFYNGSETIPASVIVTGGTVEFDLSHDQWLEIEGIPTGFTYEITETDASGYAVEATGGKGTISAETSEAEFVNTFLSGGLQVAKSVVSALSADKTQKFAFTVTLADTTVNGTYGDMTFENGAATFELADGESVSASGLPEGMAFTVAEAQTSGFASSVTSGSAQDVIALDEVKRIVFTNTRNEGSLSISKTVAGATTDEVFTFDVQLDAPIAAGAYGEMTFSETGAAVVTLKAGETKTATGLPEGVGYTVTERTNENYTTTATGSAGTISAQTAASASFVNSALGGLEVSKSITGNAADTEKKFTFTVTLDDTSISGVYGEMTFENGVATFELGDGESKTAEKLPAGVGYTVTEESGEYAASSSNATGTIPGLEIAEAAFVNSLNIDYGSLIVKKTITGDAADKTKKFTFRVTLDQKISGAYGEMTFKNGVATFELGDGEMITANRLPAGVGYTVRELDSADYVVTCTYETGTIEAMKTVTATFINNRSKGDVPKTGDDSHLGLYAVMLAMSSAAMLYMALRRRRA